MVVLEILWKIITFPFKLLVKLFDLCATIGSMF